MKNGGAQKSKKLLIFWDFHINKQSIKSVFFIDIPNINNIYKRIELNIDNVWIFLTENTKLFSFCEHSFSYELNACLIILGYCRQLVQVFFFLAGFVKIFKKQKQFHKRMEKKTISNNTCEHPVIALLVQQQQQKNCFGLFFISIFLLLFFFLPVSPFLFKIVNRNHLFVTQA